MRRPRSDSIAAAVMAAHAPNTVAPPSHISLSHGDMPFWIDIVSARPISTWNGSDLVLAAELARCRADVETLRAEIRSEGGVLKTAEHPGNRLLETLVKRSVYLSRLLHVHAEATQGESRHQAKRSVPERDAKAAVRDALIPRLSAVR